MTEIVNLAVKRLCDSRDSGVDAIRDEIIKAIEDSKVDFNWSEFDILFEKVCFALEDRKMLSVVLCR